MTGNGIPPNVPCPRCGSIMPYTARTEHEGCPPKGLLSPQRCDGYWLCACGYKAWSVRITPKGDAVLPAWPPDPQGEREGERGKSTIPPATIAHERDKLVRFFGKANAEERRRQLARQSVHEPHKRMGSMADNPHHFSVPDEAFVE